MKANAITTLWEHLPAAAGAPSGASPIAGAVPPADQSLPELRATDDAPQTIGPYVVREVLGEGQYAIVRACERRAGAAPYEPNTTPPVASPVLSPRGTDANGGGGGDGGYGGGAEGGSRRTRASEVL